jgi:peptidoglycan hydrolase CwlO-like protein
MSKRTVLATILIISLSLTFSQILQRQGFAQDPEEDLDIEKVSNLEDKIKKFEEKLQKLQTQEQTLSREIESANSQIVLTELRISNSVAKLRDKEDAIRKISGDIDNLKIRIVKLEEAIRHQEKVLGQRLRARYKSFETSAIVYLFGSPTFNSLVQKSEYLKVMEHQDKKLMTQMSDTKIRYGQQKDLFEEKKVSEETLKAQIQTEKTNLESYQNQLANQKLEKQKLLELTQNDEAKYQNMLEEARRELNQIIGAVSVLKDQQSKKVAKGEAIGIQGNTGYSFGDHLHFGVYKYASFKEIDGWNWYYSNYVDPHKVLKSKDVYWKTGCEASGVKSTGKGNWQWPMNNPTISQGFGYTCWSNVYYGGKPHPAYDMYGPYNAIVYAAEEGDAFFCRNCMGDGGNGVFIFHPDGYMSVYWHLK